jgi:hypothetical protein
MLILLGLDQYCRGFSVELRLRKGLFFWLYGSLNQVLFQRRTGYLLFSYLLLRCLSHGEGLKVSYSWKVELFKVSLALSGPLKG